MEKKLEQYKNELKETVEKINTIKKQVSELNKHGEQLIALANKIQGKIEAANEFLAIENANKIDEKAENETKE